MEKSASSASRMTPQSSTDPTRVDGLRVELEGKIDEALENGFYGDKIAEMEALLAMPLFAAGFQKSPISNDVRNSYIARPYKNDASDKVCNCCSENKRRRLENEPEKAGTSSNDLSTTPSSLVEQPRPRITTNAQLSEMISLIKPCIVNCEKEAKAVMTWIALSTPTIEDGGDNFGVVQERVSGLAEMVVSCASDHTEQLSGWYSKRTELLKQAIKHADVEDAWHAIEYADELQFHTLCNVVSDMRDNYVILIDMLVKNLKTIKNPTSNNSSSLY